MKKKALILGAHPRPQEGPWVPISDCEQWVVALPEQTTAIELQVQSDDLLLTFDLGERTVFSGNFARIVITEELDCSLVTIVAEEVT